VWFWLVYTKASQRSQSLHYQVTAYPGYMDLAREAGSELMHSGITLAELADQIEQTELEIWNAVNQKEMKLKPFRHGLPVTRSNVVAEIVVAWDQVAAWSKSLPCLVDEAVTRASLGRIELFCLDGHDALLVETIRQAGIRQIITDDGDFVTVPHIQVFTANRGALRAAAAQGKLMKRK